MHDPDLTRTSWGTVATILEGVTVRFLKGEIDVRELFSICERRLKRSLSHEEFKSIAAIANRYGYSIDADKEYGEVMMSAELEGFFNGLAPAGRLESLYLQSDD